jgi:hypothetical protein
MENTPPQQYRPALQYFLPGLFCDYGSEYPLAKKITVTASRFPKLTSTNVPQSHHNLHLPQTVRRTGIC